MSPTGGADRCQKYTHSLLPLSGPWAPAGPSQSDLSATYSFSFSHPCSPLGYKQQLGIIASLLDGPPGINLRVQLGSLTSPNPRDNLDLLAHKP